MNKAELSENVALELKVSNVEGKKAVEAFIKCLSKALKKGEDVRLSEFGTFQVVKRAPRTLRNPQNGLLIKVPAKKTVKLNISPILKAKIAK